MQVSHVADPKPPGGLPALLCAVVAAAPGMLAGLRQNPDLSGGSLLNPDSAMRLVRLQDIIETGHPLHAVLRDGSGQGTVLHWSHCLDALLLILAGPLAPWLGWPAALQIAGVVSGPLSMAALGVAVAWAAAPVARASWLWLAAFAAGAAPVLGAYGMLGVVHHHVLLTVTSVMAAGHTLRLLRGADPVAGGLALGAWIAAGLWLSPEALPFGLAATGALWVAWLRRPNAAIATALLGSAATLLVLAALIVAVDPPAAGPWAAEPDRVSLPFVILAEGATGAAAVARLARHRGAAVECGALSALLWLATWPHLLRGTEGLMPPEAAAAFFGVISEMGPVDTIDQALASLLGGSFAAAALMVFASRARGPDAAALAWASVCTLAVVALTALHVRFTPYPAAAGAVLLPVVLTRISDATMAPVARALARVAVIVLLLCAPPSAPMAALAAAPPRQTTALPCPFEGAVALLNDQADAVVLAGINETPGLLHRTGVRTVGSLYHRNPDAFMRLRAAWRAVPGPIPNAEFRATGATLVLACPGEARSAIVGDLAPGTLLDRLNANDPPSWLMRVADAGPGGFVLYRVRATSTP